VSEPSVPTTMGPFTFADITGQSLGEWGA